MVGAALGALVSIYTALHYTILLGAQIPMVAARDGLFPRAFQRLTNRGTPGVALLATGLLITGLIVMNASKGLVRAYTFINLMATLATVIPYAFCAMAAPGRSFRKNCKREALAFVSAASQSLHSAAPF